MFARTLIRIAARDLEIKLILPFSLLIFNTFTLRSSIFILLPQITHKINALNLWWILLRNIFMKKKNG